MVISDGVEVLLGVERAAQEERKVAVGRLDDVGNLVDRLAPIESVLVCETILKGVGEHDAGTECLSYTGKEGRIHDRRTTGIWGRGRHVPVSLAVGGWTKAGSGCRGWNGLVNERRTHVCRRGGGQGPRAVLQRAITTEGPRHGAGGV